MEEEILDAIRKLGKLRKGVPQYFLCDHIMPWTVLSIRAHITELKAKYADANEVDVILQSPGGLADDAYRIIRALRKNFDNVNVIVPFWAKSAATLVAMGGSTIVMDEFGEFGPLDAQIGKVREDSPEFDRESALNDEHSISRIEVRFKEMYEAMYIRIYEHKKINIHRSELSDQLLSNLSHFYEPLLAKIDPYKLGDKRRKLDIGAHYARRILTQFGKCNTANVRLLVDYLVNGCPDHAYVIDYDIMKGFLDNVFQGNKFGAPYGHALSELSARLMGMSNPEAKHLGFIEPVEPKTSDASTSAKTEKANARSGKTPKHLTSNIPTNGSAKGNGKRKPAKAVVGAN